MTNVATTSRHSLAGTNIPKAIDALYAYHRKEGLVTLGELDRQLAFTLDLHPATIRRWRRGRGLPHYHDFVRLRAYVDGRHAALTAISSLFTSPRLARERREYAAIRAAMHFLATDADREREEETARAVNAYLNRRVVS